MICLRKTQLVIICPPSNFCLQKAIRHDLSEKKTTRHDLSEKKNNKSRFVCCFIFLISQIISPKNDQSLWVKNRPHLFSWTYIFFLQYCTTPAKVHSIEMKTTGNQNDCNPCTFLLWLNVPRNTTFSLSWCYCVTYKKGQGHWNAYDFMSQKLHKYHMHANFDTDCIKLLITDSLPMNWEPPDQGLSTSSIKHRRRRHDQAREPKARS